MRKQQRILVRRLQVLAIVTGLWQGAGVAGKALCFAEEEEARLTRLAPQGASHPMPPVLSPAAEPATGASRGVPVVVRTGPAPATPDFVLGPGDELKMTVWGYPELSEQVIILPDGTVSYPLIGSLKAAGLTTRELATTISRALEAQIHSPNVSLVVSQMRSRQFSVVGDVERAGTFPLWNDQVTVLEAVAQAGGLKSTALAQDTAVLRVSAQGHARQVISASLAMALEDGDSKAFLTLQPGDVVYVPSQSDRRKVCVLGEVAAPGLYALTPKMTVVEGLTAAGWAKPSGVLRNVMVVRRSETGEQEFFKLDAQRIITKQDWTQDLPLKPGDIVYVPEHLIAKIGEFVSFFSSQVEPAAHAYLRVYDSVNPANVVVDR